MRLHIIIYYLRIGMKVTPSSVSDMLFSHDSLFGPMSSSLVHHVFQNLPLSIEWIHIVAKVVLAISAQPLALTLIFPNEGAANFSPFRIFIIVNRFIISGGGASSQLTFSETIHSLWKPTIEKHRGSIVHHQRIKIIMKSTAAVVSMAHFRWL